MHAKGAHFATSGKKYFGTNAGCSSVEIVLKFFIIQCFGCIFIDVLNP
jgi:hypothetical protein